MNKAAVMKGDIYNKLAGFTEQELAALASFIDAMKCRKEPEKKKIIKLEGIIRDYDIDFSDLKLLREETWKHLDEEFEKEMVINAA